jgi:hypothetical protein
MSDWERAVVERRAALQGELEALDRQAARLQSQLSGLRVRQDQVRDELEVLARLGRPAPKTPPATPTALLPEPPPAPPSEEGVDYTVIRQRILERFLVPRHGPMLPTGPGKKVYFHTPDWSLAVHILASATHVKGGRRCGWFGVHQDIFEQMRTRASTYELIFAALGVDWVYRVPSDNLRPHFLRGSTSTGGDWHMNLYVDSDELTVPRVGTVDLSTFRLEHPGLWRAESR